MQADLVLTNGNVLTMNTSQLQAEAVALTKDRILKVGSNSEIAPLIGKNTKTLDLKGKTVIPGFIDTHIHVADFGRTLAWINLKEADSIQALQNLVKEKTATVGRGKWVLGSGWNQENFEEKRLPTRQDLDNAAPNNPVILYHLLGRTGVTNSKGLELAGITKDSVDQKGGLIEKNPETGELTGILQGAATDLIWSVVPVPTEQETTEGAMEACRKIVAAGITSVHWIVASAAELRIAKKLSLDNSVPLRIFIIATADVFENLPISEETDLKIGGGLIFADGYLASQSAALSEPYAETTANSGQLMYTQEELNRLAAKIHRAKLQVIIHAMGDKAVNAALKALETVSTEQSLNKRRHRLEQAALLNRPLIERTRKLGVVISIQPKVVESEFAVWSATEHLGKKRARLLFPLKTLLRKGVCIAGGSDCPMEPLNPLVGIESLVARKSFPEERLTIEEAFGLYTVNAAYATQEEALKGSIEEGKLADLTILSGDPMGIASDRLADVEVKMTIIGGKVVYQKAPL